MAWCERHLENHKGKVRRSACKLSQKKRISFAKALKEYGVESRRFEDDKNSGISR